MTENSGGSAGDPSKRACINPDKATFHHHWPADMKDRTTRPSAKSRLDAFEALKARPNL